VWACVHSSPSGTNTSVVDSTSVYTNHKFEIQNVSHALYDAGNGSTTQIRILDHEAVLNENLH
jgi:ribonuclease HI